MAYQTFQGLHSVVGGLLLIAAACLLGGCAQMQADYIAKTCNTDAAYAAGVNHGKNGDDMVGNYGMVAGCPDNIDALNQAYSKGFTVGLESGAALPPNTEPEYQCKSSFGNEVCGYNCVKSNNNVQCASTPDQMCVAGKFGSTACGYGCAKSSKEVKCASRRRDNCVADNFGKIQCGRNCRIEKSKIVCDEAS